MNKFFIKFLFFILFFNFKNELYLAKNKKGAKPKNNIIFRNNKIIEINKKNINYEYKYKKIASYIALKKTILNLIKKNNLLKISNNNLNFSEIYYEVINLKKFYIRNFNKKNIDIFSKKLFFYEKEIYKYLKNHNSNIVVK